MSSTNPQDISKIEPAAYSWVKLIYISFRTSISCLSIISIRYCKNYIKHIFLEWYLNDLHKKSLQIWKQDLHSESQMFCICWVDKANRKHSCYIDCYECCIKQWLTVAKITRINIFIYRSDTCFCKNGNNRMHLFCIFSHYAWLFKNVLIVEI